MTQDERWWAKYNEVKDFLRQTSAIHPNMMQKKEVSIATGSVITRNSITQVG